MNTSNNGINLIISFEGYRSKAYKCPANVNTIGYGTTIYPNGKKVQLGDTCTKEQAITYLKHDLIKFENVVKNKCKGCVLNQNQFDALVSFAYNTGTIGNTMVSCLKKGDYKGCSNSMKEWNKATVNGKKVVLAGLTRRRESESKLFLTPIANQKTNKIENKTNTELDTLKQCMKKYKVLPEISIKQNNKHELVKSLQSYLKKLGYYTSTIDGIAGKNFDSAIKKFQKANKLQSDGCIGKNTWNCINKKVK